MKHLDDQILNQYLDQQLSKHALASAQAHLDACHICRARLAEMESLFTALGALPDVALQKNLAPAVMAALREKTAPTIWSRTFAAQLGMALGLALWAAMQAAAYIQIPQVEIPQLPSLDWEALLASFTNLYLTLLSYEIPSISYQLPALPLEISTEQIVTLTVLTFLTWAAGNYLLLRSRSEVRQ
ncbi:MAG: hypothetical protein Kow002_00400 [Anaerolineales bacterium]